MPPPRLIAKWIFYSGSILLILVSCLAAGSMIFGMAYYYFFISTELVMLETLPIVLALAATFLIPAFYIIRGRRRWQFFIAIFIAAVSLLTAIGLGIVQFIYYAPRGLTDAISVTAIVASLCYLFLLAGTLLRFRGYWHTASSAAVI